MRELSNAAELKPLTVTSNKAKWMKPHNYLIGG